MLPAEEKNSLSRVHSDLLILVRIEFNPVLWNILCDGWLDDHADDGAILCLVCPVPK